MWAYFTLLIQLFQLVVACKVELGADLHLILAGWETRTDTPLHTEQLFLNSRVTLKTRVKVGLELQSERVSLGVRVALQVWGGLARVLQWETSHCEDCSSMWKPRQNTERRRSPCFVLSRCQVQT